MKTTIKKNEIRRLCVDDINNLGYGVGRIDGVVCFVAGGVSGDALDARIIKIARDYLVARIERIISPSPFRTERACPVSAQCGGCAYDGVDYAHELDLKRNFVVQAFRKAGLPDVAVEPVVSDGRTLGYRNKLAIPVDGARVGFYGTHSHDIIDCKGRCALSSPLITAPAEFIAAELAGTRIPALRHIFMRAAEGTGEAMCCFVVRDAEKTTVAAVTRLAERTAEEFTQIKSVLLNVHPEETNVILGREFRLILGREYIEDKLCGLRFRISPDAFYQVNHDMTERLYRCAAEKAALKAGEKLLDLFCGAGTVGLSMAAHLPGCSLTGVEIVPSAVENARRNAEVNGMDSAQFICADANAVDIGKYDVIVVDPPRKGVAPELIDRIADSGNRRLVYISCNPATLARDCALFAERGYTIGAATPHDLFPRTGHCESIVKLIRSDMNS